MSQPCTSRFGICPRKRRKKLIVQTLASSHPPCRTWRTQGCSFFFRSHGRMVNAESWRRLIGSSSSASDTRRRQKAVTQSCEGQDARGKSWQQMRPKPFAKKWTMESPRGSGKPNEHLDAQRRSSRNPRRAIVRLTPKLLLERSPPLLAKREGPGDAAPEAPRTQPNDSRKDAKAHRKGSPKQHQKLVENSTWKPRKRRS
jgi:hypothetical protein